MSKHISLDFWNTVGQPNKDYIHRRSEIIADFYNVSFAEAKRMYTLIKSSLDKGAEQTGTCHDYMENYWILSRAFVFDDEEVRNPAELAKLLAEAFAENPPLVSDTMRESLFAAKRAGFTLSIGSNTNFITGREIVDHVLADMPFDFLIFSDEIMLSKPHQYFFQTIVDQAMQVNNNVHNASDVIHIGDHRVCDVEGAIRRGLRAEICRIETTPDVINQIINEEIVDA